MGKRSKRKAARRKGDAKAEQNPQAHHSDDATQAARLKALNDIAEFEREVYRQAHELYLAEGGHEIELMLETGQLTGSAYRSQIRADKEGGRGWGPNITPYEDRMTRSLQIKLMREKREWIESCRQKILRRWEAITMPADKAPEPETEPEQTPEPEDNEFGNPKPTAPETEAVTQTEKNQPVLSSTASP